MSTLRATTALDTFSEIVMSNTAARQRAVEFLGNLEALARPLRFLAERPLLSKQRLFPGFRKLELAQIEKSVVTELTITGAKALGPVHVFLEDLEPGRVQITLSCFDQSWTAAWSAMSGRSMGPFFANCDEHYLAGKLSCIPHRVYDCDAIEAHAKRAIRLQRRDEELSAEEARELFDRVPTVEDPMLEPNLMQSIYGDNWWGQLPEKINPNYSYLCSVINAVRDALKSLQTRQAQEPVSA